MATSRPDAPVNSAFPRIAATVLAVVLAIAGVYIMHLQGRVTELESQLAAVKPRPAPAPPAAAAAPVPTTAPANLFTAEQRAAVLTALRAETDPARKAWITVQQNNAESASIAIALKAVFTEAGWPTEMVRYPYQLKSGLFILAGDTQPPSYVSSANDALTAGGLEVQYLTGYRDFVADRKQNSPNWVGPELKPDQAFSIVVGSKPAK